jgi:hypothetical protein
MFAAHHVDMGIAATIVSSMAIVFAALGFIFGSTTTVLLCPLAALIGTILGLLSRRTAIGKAGLTLGLSVLVGSAALTLFLVVRTENASGPVQMTSTSAAPQP